MNKLPMPIKVPYGCRILMTQKYANKSNNAWYASRGVDAPFHNGVDLVLADVKGKPNQILTYGAALITPSDGWQIVKTTFDSPMSTKGNGVTIESPSFLENGMMKKLQVVYWHCSEIENKKGPIQIYDTVAYIGNSGIVNPAPTPNCAFCGTHLHLMLFEFTNKNGIWYLDNYDNGVNGAVDPLSRFDEKWLIHGEDTPKEKDLPPLQYMIDHLKTLIKALFGTR